MFVADSARAHRLDVRSNFRTFSGLPARASRVDPKGPTLTKHRYGRCFVRVRLGELEPKIGRNSLRERFPNDLRTHPKIKRNSGENRSEIDLRANRAKKTQFFRSETRLGIDFGRLGALLGAPGRSFWRQRACLGILQALLRSAGDAPQERWGRPETLPRRSRDAFGTRLGATIHAERVQGPICDQFWVSGGLSSDRFSTNFCCQ